VAAMSIWAKLQTRSKLVKAFKSGGLHLTYKMSDGNERLILPKIRNVSINNSSTTITFTLPNGLDPKLLQKNFYVFEQYFGRNVELDGEVKRFTLTINNKTLPTELTYNYAKIEPELEGLEMPVYAARIAQETGWYMTPLPSLTASYRANLALVRVHSFEVS
jgi:S-DNA-T family DNA segregation ATPase FtsK/SpoIIIE